MVLGKKALEEIFKEKKVAFNSHNISKVLEFFKIPAANDLFYSIGVGNFKLSDIDHFTREGDNIIIKDEKKDSQDIELAIKNKLVSNSNLWMFGDGESSVDYNLAQCCKPIPGDDVFGFVNKNKEVEIHRTNCPKAISTIAKYGYDIVRTKWTRQHQIAFLTGLKLTGIDDVGVMQKITSVISGDLKVNMQSISIDTRDGIFTGIIKVFVKDTNHLQELIDMLRSLDGILSVARFEEEAVAV